MRVTQSSLTRNYMKNLNRNISNLSNSSSKLTSLRRFSKVSENTADASRAFSVREQLYKNDQHLTNIRDAEGELSSAESNMMSINSILQTVEERVLQGKTGTISPVGQEIIAREINNLKEQVIQVANSKYGDKYLFGGSNNSTTPFTLDANGAVMFNGVDISKIELDPATGKPSVSDGATPPNYTIVAENADVFIDVGLGLTMTGTNLDTRTALKVSTSGLSMLGYGTSTTSSGATMPNNILVLLDKIAKEFSAGDMSSMGDNLEHLTKVKDEFMMNITDIGNRANFLSQTTGRIESDMINLQEAQKKLEGINIEEETIYNKSYEMAWMVTLQLGSKILPPSIFDFMR